MSYMAKAAAPVPVARKLDHPCIVHIGRAQGDGHGNSNQRSADVARLNSGAYPIENFPAVVDVIPVLALLTDGLA
jgi:hypothetical protein